MGRLAGAPTQVEVKSKAADKIPDVGEKAPNVATDTLESVKGDEALLDTRDPASDMHNDFEEGRRQEARRLALRHAAIVRFTRVRAGR